MLNLLLVTDLNSINTECLPGGALSSEVPCDREPSTEHLMSLTPLRWWSRLVSLEKGSRLRACFGFQITRRCDPTCNPVAAPTAACVGVCFVLFWRLKKIKNVMQMCIHPFTLASDPGDRLAKSVPHAH